MKKGAQDKSCNPLILLLYPGADYRNRTGDLHIRKRPGDRLQDSRSRWGLAAGLSRSLLESAGADRRADRHSFTNGTNTIRICGKESAIEDHSYFATSIGNEPATQAFGKGVATSVITGKAYFTQWSFDVVFEGFGVPRHTDMVSHNHGSMPSNTPLFPYLSRSWGGHDCNKEQDRIERACKPEKESYYNACKNSRPKMVNAQAKPVLPGSGSGSGSGPQ